MQAIAKHISSSLRLVLFTFSCCTVLGKILEILWVQNALLFALPENKLFMLVFKWEKESDQCNNEITALSCCEDTPCPALPGPASPEEAKLHIKQKWTPFFIFGGHSLNLVAATPPGKRPSHLHTSVEKFKSRRTSWQGKAETQRELVRERAAERAEESLTLK